MRVVAIVASLVCAIGALGVAGLAAWKVLTLPDQGSVRYRADDPRSELAHALANLKPAEKGLTVDYRGVKLLGASLIEHGRADEMPGATYWASPDLAERRGVYVSAGGLTAGALLGAGLLLAVLGRRRHSGRPAS